MDFICFEYILIWVTTDFKQSLNPLHRSNPEETGLHFMQGNRYVQIILYW
jgi:hypothetical protein